MMMKRLLSGMDEAFFSFVPSVVPVAGILGAIWDKCFLSVSQAVACTCFLCAPERR